MKAVTLSLLAISLGSSILTASAQDFSDALRYSYLMPQGTAQSMGFGNALGSVGGDFSSIAVNPAGLGIYKSGEIQFTPNLKVNSVTGQYLGTSASDNNTHFSFSSAGVVFTHAPKGERYNKSPWKSVSFAFGVNKLADFNRDYQYSGNNSGSSSSSQTDQYAVNFQNRPSDTSFEGSNASLGWYSELLDDTGATRVPWRNGINQSRMVQERGSTNELDFALGGNYRNKLLLGVTLGIPIINHSITSDYMETALNPDPSTFTSYNLHETYTTNGTGINGKFGIIYKFTDHFRIGGAIHTPTYYAMHDESTITLTNNTPSFASGLYPPTSTFDYNLTTPWRGVLSATGFIGNIAFITADYEYIDYSTARFNFGSDPNYGNLQEVQTNANKLIKQNLQAASNFRVGAEVYVSKIFILRAGAGYYGNPYKNNNGVDCSSLSLSGGFGFRFQRFFIDGAFMHTQYNGLEQPYATPYTNVTVPTATLQNSISNAVLTFGYKFRS